MPPTYTPRGHCQKCGYPMDPGVCPECGTECTDVGPVARVGWRVYGWAAGVGLLPVVWAAATYGLHRWAGMNAGALIGIGYLLVLPVVMVAGTAVLVDGAWKRTRKWRHVLLLLVLIWPLGVASWVVGWAVGLTEMVVQLGV